MRCNARTERGEIITSLERRDEPAAGMAIGDLEQPLGDPSIVSFFEQELRQRVASMRVEACGDKQELGTECLERGQDALPHSGAKLARARHRSERHVNDVADTSFACRPGAGVERGLVCRCIEEPVIGLESRLSAVAVMNIEIDDGDPVELVRRASVQRADGDVVEQTESHRTLGFGMMPRRAYGAEGVVRLPRDYRI